MYGFPTILFPFLIQVNRLASLDAFKDFVGRYRDIGISEFNFRWPQAKELAVFERIAYEGIPSLRKSITVRGVVPGEL